MCFPPTTGGVRIRHLQFTVCISLAPQKKKFKKKTVDNNPLTISILFHYKKFIHVCIIFRLKCSINRVFPTPRNMFKKSRRKYPDHIAIFEFFVFPYYYGFQFYGLLTERLLLVIFLIIQSINRSTICLYDENIMEDLNCTTVHEQH